MVSYMISDDLDTKKACLFQWVFVLLMGLFGAVIGATGVASPGGLPGNYWAIGIGLMAGLTVSGVGVSFYMRWKQSRRRA